MITGFMATGKSTVGRRLAQRLGRRFVDTDQLIEERANASVAEIFAHEGEAGFRARERDAVATACGLSDVVIAIGGGALTDAGNRALLQAAGPLVCLEASAEEILKRVGDASSRPLLASAKDRLQRIRELQAEREPVYALATHRIDTTGLGLDDVVERVRTIVATAV